MLLLARLSVRPGSKQKIPYVDEAAAKKLFERFGAGHVEDLLAAIDPFAFLVTAAPPCPEPLPDPDDEPILAVAAATGSVLVTGNLKHFLARSRGGILLQTPREFVDRLRW